MTKIQRSILMLLATVAAVAVGVVAALAASGGHRSTGMDMNMAMPATAQHGSVTSGELALRLNMRRLWTDHVLWTRLAVISLVGGLPDAKPTVARLLQNQADIGNAVKPYYGAAAGNKLTALLRQHILIAADLIAAAKAGNDAAVQRQQARWSANADTLAAFLSSANPKYWKRSDLRSMLGTHLALTTAEVVDRLQHKWGADVREYDEIQNQALGMADMFSNGIIGQFASRFG